MDENVFSVLIATLNSVTVSGEDNFKRMLSVLKVLHVLENAANTPEGGEADG